MEPSRERILRAALELPEGDRLALAERLIQSVDGSSDPAIEAAWRDEIRARVEQIEKGKVRLVAGDEVMRKLRSLFGGRAA